MSAAALRVIVFEDEALLSLDIEDQVSDLGCVVAGTAARLAPALELAQTANFDVALLDMNLAGERIDPVAHLIVARGLPVIFVTGYGQRTFPPGIAAPVIDKPCTTEKLVTLFTAFAERRGG